MDSRPNYRLISFLILKERLGTLEPSEAEELESWKVECSQHQELYDQLKQKDLVAAFARYDKIDVEKGLIKYRRRYARRKVRHLWISAAVYRNNRFVLIGSGRSFGYNSGKHFRYAKDRVGIG